MEDSESDWDSMSEAPVVAAGKPPPSSHHDRQNDLSRTKSPAPSHPDQYQPPFDFSNEAKLEKKTQEAQQTKPSARKVKTYAVTVDRNEKSGSRFSSPALKSLQSHQSPSLNPEAMEAIPKSKTASLSQPTDSRALKRTKKLLPQKILEPQETLDDIVNDPLDEDNPTNLSDEGIDNPAFYPDGSYEVEEKFDFSDEGRFNREKAGHQRIIPDERIQILPFSDIQTRYFQIHSESSEVWADRILEPTTHCCSWCLSEVFGILKIPFILLFVLLGQILKFLIQAIVAPISNWIMKPLIVHTHNYLWMPLCSGLLNLCSAFAQAVHPFFLIINCCSLRKNDELSENVRNLKVV